MKRSEINTVFEQASACFTAGGWALPPNPRWDITDFGLRDFPRFGLTLVNLAEEPEYCEKLMYARRDQRTPLHTHQQKKEDIICRQGELSLLLYPGLPEEGQKVQLFELRVNGETISHPAGDVLVLPAGSRVTLVPGVYHEFWPSSEECIIGEVSTANDDLTDNFFVNPEIGRFPGIEEDEPPRIRLFSEPA